VLCAYGWDDLAERAAPEFIEQDADEGKTSKTRLDWPAEFKDEVLARLLALNAERAAAEKAAGVTAILEEEEEGEDLEEAAVASKVSPTNISKIVTRAGRSTTVPSAPSSSTSPTGPSRSSTERVSPTSIFSHTSFEGGANGTSVPPRHRLREKNGAATSPTICRSIPGSTSRRASRPISGTARSAITPRASSCSKPCSARRSPSRRAG
jgi:hypothetical protein